MRSWCTCAVCVCVVCAWRALQRVVCAVVFVFVCVCGRVIVGM